MGLTEKQKEKLVRYGEKWEDVLPKFKAFVESEASKIAGWKKRPVKFSGFDYLNVNFDIAFGVGCSLDCMLNYTRMTFDNVDYLVYTVSCQIGWSSTQRTIAESLASIELYRQVTTLGAMIEAKFGKQYLEILED